MLLLKSCVHTPSFDKFIFRSLFKSETGPNYYKEVPLSEILAVDTAKTHSGEIFMSWRLSKWWQ